MDTREVAPAWCRSPSGEGILSRLLMPTQEVVIIWKFLTCGCGSLQHTGSSEGPHGLRPLTVLLGIVAQLLIRCCSGIALRSVLLVVGSPRIEFRLPVLEKRSTPVNSTLTLVPWFLLLHLLALPLRVPLLGEDLPLLVLAHIHGHLYPSLLLVVFLSGQ